jgi:hypothetical protein
LWSLQYLGPARIEHPRNLYTFKLTIINDDANFEIILIITAIVVSMVAIVSLLIYVYIRVRKVTDRMSRHSPLGGSRILLCKLR